MKQIDIQFKTFRFKGDPTTYFCPSAKVDYNLNVLGFFYIPIINNVLPTNYMDKSIWRHCPKERFKDVVISQFSGLAGPYTPASEMPNGFSLKVDIPDSMDESMDFALKQLKQAVGNVAEFVAERLQFSIAELADCLSLEQIDAVALAIYNVEQRNQGLIVGDQTGIGKGRIAASFIRYGVLHGYKPVFFTEKPALFSDIMRDLNDIHSGYFVPFIVNKTGGEILDDEGFIAQYRDKTEIDSKTKECKIKRMANQEEAFEYAMQTGELPKGFDFVCCTYSQFKDDKVFLLDSDDPEDIEKCAKLRFMVNICKDNIIVLDEAHNSGGEVTIDKKGNVSGNIGMAFQTKFLLYCKGVLYLSATYAKFPKNMPVYAINTCIADIANNISKEDLQKSLGPASVVSSLSHVKDFFSSVPAQEIISSNLCKFGQFIRRERKTAGMVVDYLTLDADGHLADPTIPDLKSKHFDIYNNITEILQEMKEYQEDYFIPYLQNVAANLAAQGKRGKKPPNVASASLSSALFHLTNNILLSLKAEAIAERAIYHIENGKAVVIALADTNEAYLNKEKEKAKENGEEISADQFVIAEGQRIKADYSFVFDKIFKNLFKYYVKKKNNYKCYSIDVEQLESVTAGAIEEYRRIINKFETTTTGLCMSPIDVITDIIERKGYKVAECTGRGKYLKFDNESRLTATVEAMSTKNGKRFSSQQGRHVSLCYKAFNNNEVDVLIINQSGSTGKSAHATNKNTKLKIEQVKQRVMIVAQAELDVNTEVQKRGRINRTGQIASLPPKYEYITSGLPAEKRFMIMLKDKLKSLDANTTANQKQSNESVLKVGEGEDFFNKYGDEIVENLLNNNKRLNHILNDPLTIEADPVNPKRIKQPVSEMAKTVFGRMQILSPYDQENYLNVVTAAYINKKRELIENDAWDLEIKELNYDAEFISEVPHRIGEATGNHSELKGSSFMSLYSVRSQTHYATKKDIEESIKQNIANGNDKVDFLLEKIELDLKSNINSIDQYAKQKADERDKENEDRLARMQEKLQNYIEYEMPKERLELQKKAIDEFKAKMAEEKGQIDPSYEERKENFRERYRTLKGILPLLKVGNVYKTDTCIYVIVSVITSEDAFDALSKPSAIIVNMITTNEYESHSSKNLADTGMEFLKELVKNKSSLDEYDKYVSDDTRREEKYIITGNIVPLIAKGTVISRFTMKDGSYQNGIVVKPKIINGEAEIPPEYRYVTIPINETSMNAVKRQLVNNNSTMQFSSSVGSGIFEITGMRFGDRIKFHLKAEMNYGNFLKTESLMECYEDQYQGLTKDGGYWTGYIENVDKFLKVLSEYHFATQISMSLAEEFKDTINTQRYKTKDWTKLSYDKNKIPKDYIGKLLLREFETLFKRKEVPQKETKTRTKKQ